MIRYLLRRTVLLLVSLFVASVLIFLLLRLLPGDVATTIGGLRATPAQLARIRAGLGLDRPLTAQYGSWLVGVLHGDFGHSQLTGVSVTAELDRKLQVTAPLVGGGIVVALLLAVPFGILAALRHRSGIGGGISAIAQLGVAVPTFWLGLVLGAAVRGGVAGVARAGFPDRRLAVARCRVAQPDPALARARPVRGRGAAAVRPLRRARRALRRLPAHRAGQGPHQDRRAAHPRPAQRRAAGHRRCSACRSPG